MIRLLLVVSIFICASSIGAQSIYLDSKFGSDANSGTKESPLKTLKKAAEIVNEAKGFKSTTVYLNEGIYILDSAVVFKPTIAYTKTNRFVLRAVYLPDEEAWTPSQMPTILPTLQDQTADSEGTWSNGIQVEVNHASIKGIKIMGSPVFEYLDSDKIIRSYPIVREGSKLDDLEISQCLFVGDEHVLPLHLGIYAAGNNVKVDQCIFLNCKVGVLFVNYLDQPTIGNILTNNLFIGAYGAATWLMNISEDFVFEGNSIVNSNYGIIVEKGNPKKYNISNSLFSGVSEIVGNGEGALLNFTSLGIDALNLETGVKITSNPVTINLDQSQRNYLHIIQSPEYQTLQSGLFKEKD